MEAYINTIRHYIWQQTRSLRPGKDNLTTEERLALQKLRARTDIIIKPADKGSTTVVMSKEASIREAERQLENETYYHQLDTDPTSIHAAEISSFIQTMAEKELIPKDTEKYLTTNNPKTARFYHLPKIHKPGNPGRPIISSCGAPSGNYQCQDKRCHTCKIIFEKNTFTSKINGRKHNVHYTFTCKTRNLVYLIQCKKCGLQYIGETENPLHVRISGHRSDINTRKTEKPVAAYFNQPDHCLQDLQVMGIEKIHTNDTTRRKLRASYWIFTTETLTPSGMNVDE